tara:strand:+ start:668 stop:952 length:285 start_codon:yes stop_codon:yes gene_type:complete
VVREETLVDAILVKEHLHVVTLPVATPQSILPRPEGDATLVVVVGHSRLEFVPDFVLGDAIREIDEVHRAVSLGVDANVSVSGHTWFPDLTGRN